MDFMWWAVIGGVVFGAILSVVFGVYSKSTATSYARSIFGMDSTNLITNSILMIVAGAFVFLATVSALVRDLSYPMSRPLNFSIELFLMAFLPSVVIFAMTLLRGYKIGVTTFEEFGVLFVKFGALHVLLQFSGFYSYLFPPK